VLRALACILFDLFSPFFYAATLQAIAGSGSLPRLFCLHTVTCYLRLLCRVLHRIRPPSTPSLLYLPQSVTNYVHSSETRTNLKATKSSTQNANLLSSLRTLTLQSAKEKDQQWK